MTNLKIDFNENLPLRELVFRTLREAIITGQLETGERLMEVKLAGDLGVSRTPVREAIAKLEREGLVTSSAGRGAHVAPINKKDLREVLEIRKAMESLACRLASQNAGEEQIAELKRINAQIADAIIKEDILEITRLDVKFHEVIINSTDNERLKRVLRQLKEHVYRYRFEYIKDMEKRSSIYNEHEKIIAALEKKNAAAAAREIERHIEAQEKYILMRLPD